MTRVWCRWSTAMTRVWCRWSTAMARVWCRWCTAMTRVWCRWSTAMARVWCRWRTAMTRVWCRWSTVTVCLRHFYLEWINCKVSQISKTAKTSFGFYIYFNLGPALPKLFVEINKQYLSLTYADYWYISVIIFDSENTELADYSLFNLLFVLRSEGF